MLPSKKGQGNLETLILIGGGVLVAVIIVTILVSLGGQSRDSASEQVDDVSSSTDGPLPPTITSVKANYLDCETIDVGGTLRKIGLLSFSWKPLSREGTYKLIIENKDNDVLNEGDYTVILDGNIIPEDNLNPIITNNLIVSDIDLGNGSCGDSYYLSIEVSKNNQSKKSSRYSFNWSDSGPKTTVISRPLFNPVPGSYNYFSFPSTITLDVSDPSFSVYYTIDGSDPYTSGIPYTLGLPISISPGTTIMAYSEYNSVKSGIASGTYTVSYDTVSSVTATPDSSINLEDPINVVLSSATSSSTIYYTLDSSIPDCSGSFSEYTSPINVLTDTTIKAIACRENYNDSSVSTFTYSFFVPLDPIIFNPPAGDYSTIQNITLSNSNPGATIHYTTSGFDPTLLSPVYSSPISVSSPVTIKAMAAVGLNTGPISQADYNVTLPANIAIFSLPSGTYNNNIFVDLSTTTPLPYSIYYTTNGDTPTSSSTQYLGTSIPVTRNQTLKAIVYKPGYLASSVTQADYTFKLNAPTFSPSPGAYSDSQSIAITSVAGAQIRYTINGATPTQTTGTQINSGESTVPITSTSTLRAITYKTGWTSSDVSTGVYTINAPAATPAFSPNGGTFTNSVNVTLSCTTPSSTIRYTTDGTDPTREDGTVYSSPINFTSTTTLKAVCYASGYSTSPVATQTFTVQLIASPATFSSPSGTYNNNIFVDLSTTTPLPYSIYYTTNGDTPTSSSTQYLGTSIPVTRNQTLKAIVYKPGYLASSVTQADYTFKLNAPTFSPSPGAYSDSQSIAITSVAGAQIRYTINGATPTQTTGTQINSGESTVPITSTSTLRAITYKTGWTSSDVSTGVYTINAPAATPTFSPNGGTHTNSVNVTLSCSTPSSTIRYTTDGTDPTRDDGTVYSSPINFTSTTTLKAVCYAFGYSTSPVATQTFTVQLIANPATFSSPSGTYNNNIFVDLSTTTPLPYSIYYTTNGDTPTSSSTQYLGTSIPVTRNQTLKAIVYKSGYLESSVSQADYTFKLNSPTFSPLPGTYSTAQNVVITSVPGAQISYTLDNSTPVQGGVNVINHGESVLINSPTPLKAIAYKTGWTSSDLVQGYYNVDITPDPVTVLGGGATCNANATLTATGGANGTIYYQGTTSNGTSTMNASTSEVVSSPGTYYFRARSTSGTWGTQGSATVSFNTPSVAPTSITGNTSVCSGSPTTLTAIGGTVGTGATYQWYAGTCGTAISLGSSSSLTVSPTSTTTYYARLSGTCNTTSCVSKTVTIASPPTVNVTPGERCGNGSVTLGATTTSGTIEWYTSSTGGSPIATGNSFTTPLLNWTTTYYVGVTGGTCNLTTRVPVTATILSQPGSVSISLQNSGPGFATISATGGSGGTIYFQGTTSMGTSTSLGGTPQTVNSNGTYYFRARSTNGCWGSQSSINVTIPAGLSNLELSNNPSGFAFNSNTYNYNDIFYLISTTNSITVTPTGTGTITVNGSTVSSGSASSPISISDGNLKTITVNVTQGATSATYTLKVRKIITTHTGTATVTEGISGGYAYRVHKFRSGTGTYTINIDFPMYMLEYLVVGGGGGGGGYNGNGGNAGQYRYYGLVSSSADTYDVVVGSGGSGGSYNTAGTAGGYSFFNGTIASGGSGGSSSTNYACPPQNRGGTGSGGSGSCWASPPGYGVGGPGTSNDITGSNVIYAAGGNSRENSGSAGAPNTGNGGDGKASGSGTRGLSGGSGVVIVRVQIPV